MNITLKYWDNTYESGQDYVYVGLEQLDKILSYVDKEQNLTYIDLGCGTGQLTREMYHRGFQVTGIDGSKKALEKARAATQFDIKYILADFETDFSKIIDKKANFITCKYTYAFIKDRNTFLENVSKLLEKEGVFIIISPLRTATGEAKKDITLDPNSTKKELNVVFNLLDYYDDGYDEYYICKQK